MCIYLNFRFSMKFSVHWCEYEYYCCFCQSRRHHLSFFCVFSCLYSYSFFYLWVNNHFFNDILFCFALSFLRVRSSCLIIIIVFYSLFPLLVHVRCSCNCLLFVIVEHWNYYVSLLDTFHTIWFLLNRQRFAYIRRKRKEKVENVMIFFLFNSHRQIRQTPYCRISLISITKYKLFYDKKKQFCWSFKRFCFVWAIFLLVYLRRLLNQIHVFFHFFKL